MDADVGRDRFCEMFKGRAVVVADLPAGRSRVLASMANQMAGHDDASLHTRAEYLALFDLLRAHVPPVPSTGCGRSANSLGCRSRNSAPGPWCR